MEEPASAQVAGRLHGPRDLPRDRDVRRDLVDHLADGRGGPGPAGPVRREHRRLPPGRAVIAGIREHRPRRHGGGALPAHDGGQGPDRVDPSQGPDPLDRPLPDDRRRRLRKKPRLDGTSRDGRGGSPPVVEDPGGGRAETRRGPAGGRSRGAARQGAGGNRDGRGPPLPHRRSASADGGEGGRDGRRRHRGRAGAGEAAGGRDVFRGGGALQGLPRGGHRGPDRAGVARRRGCRRSARWWRAGRPRWTSFAASVSASRRSYC